MTKMNQEKIDRINALYHKSQSVGLSPEEQEEQARCNCGHSNYCIGRMYSIEMACHQHLKETLPPCLQKEIEKLEKK